MSDKRTAESNDSDSELIKQPVKATCPNCGEEMTLVSDVSGGNARLIQAADALLVASRKVLETYQGRDTQSEHDQAEDDAVKGLRVAVAFAEGG